MTTEPAATEATTTPATVTPPTTEAEAGPLVYAEAPAAPAAVEPPAVPDYSGLKLPEGVTLEAPGVAKLVEIATAHKLPAEALQAHVDALVAGEKEAEAANAKRYADQVAAWQGEIKADPDIGGDKLDANMALARKGLAVYGSEPLKGMLESTGLIHHPAFVKFLVQVGRDAAEAPVIPSTRDAPAASPLIFDYSKSRAA